jgi:hypothetical protein
LSQTIGEIPKSAREKYVITLDKTQIDIRIYYRAESDTWLPGKKGFNMDAETWPEFRKFLYEIIEKIDQALAKGAVST